MPPILLDTDWRSDEHAVLLEVGGVWSPPNWSRSRLES